ncbi:hypothetical protein UFOVP1193_62 [uncultured Caudovirales phage]|uniref:Uncharacterized protein n=1 Tax=uncultured Caudovirales phage TaxID=2100421 RepID=A0A6J5R0N0_9CAUD|nr:hypothetical protein UFOVP1193_62 [uncultured Caudovirales phage]
MRHAVIDIKAGKVVNIVEIVDGDGSKAEDGFTHIASDVAGIGDDWDGNQIIPAPRTVVVPDWSNRQDQARYALLASDYVAIRCVKAGIDYPKDWAVRDEALREIVRADSGDATADLPEAPAKPNYSGDKT